MEKAGELAEKAVSLFPDSEEFSNTLFEIDKRKTQNKPD